MRRSHLVAATSSAALLVTAALTGTAVMPSASASSKTSGSADATSYVVLADAGTSAATLAGRLADAGGTVTSVNAAIGAVTVTSGAADFRARADKLAGVTGVATDRVIGYQPDQRADAAEVEAQLAAAEGKSRGNVAKPAEPVAGDPLDSQLWGMQMIGADKAHAVNQGSAQVKVGIIDTGVQADHPDLHANFDYALSRNFAPDDPAFDGPCEVASCLDPVGVDDGGHGTHVAGTIAAALDGFGLSGVAPKSDIVELKAGQDSGYFFLQPTLDALTYAGDNGIDVVNMSFYVDPWLYNCEAGAPQDTPEQAADQATIIEAMTRALNYAHDHGVTMVAATGNNHEDLANPRHDFTSPDFGDPAHERTIDNATCFDLPVEGPNVIGVDALGPSGKKSDFSNYTTDLGSGEVEVAAPGGWFRDGFGTPSYRTNGNLILSTYPMHVAQEEGFVDAAGNITPVGVANGVQKACQASPAPGTTPCGYYEFLQGTSMASPHAAGVAALIVAAKGSTKHGEFGFNPDATRSRLLATATDHACPAGGVQSYTQEGRSAEFTATCVGTADVNGFYGEGIVNALKAAK